MADIRTFEELLIERINKLLTALDGESSDQFDRILEHTEVLLKVKGNLYNLYIKWKEFYGQQLLLAYQRTEGKVAQIDDPYNKKLLKERNDGISEWGYRLDLLEKLVSLLNDYNLVPFGTPEYAEVQSESPSEEPPSESEPEQSEPEPVKTQEQLLDEQAERLRREEAEILQQSPPKKIRYIPQKK